jgi:hypothetical protein
MKRKCEFRVDALMGSSVNAEKRTTSQRSNPLTLSSLRPLRRCVMFCIYFLSASLRLCVKPFGPVLCALLVFHSPVAGEDNAKNEDQGYRIDKPGTITFTVGVKIKGKVEKPQVVIFLPKEKPYYRETVITHSFINDIMEPLPLKPEEK